MALAAVGNFGDGEAEAPFEALADGGFELGEVAFVKARGFGGLDGGEDIAGVGPPIDVDGFCGEAEGFERGLAAAEVGDDERVAIVEEGVRDDGEGSREF